MPKNKLITSNFIERFWLLLCLAFLISCSIYVFLQPQIDLSKLVVLLVAFFVLFIIVLFIEFTGREMVDSSTSKTEGILSKTLNVDIIKEEGSNHQLALTLYDHCIDKGCQAYVLSSGNNDHENASYPEHIKNYRDGLVDKIEAGLKLIRIEPFFEEETSWQEDLKRLSNRKDKFEFYRVSGLFPIHLLVAGNFVFIALDEKYSGGTFSFLMEDEEIAKNYKRFIENVKNLEMSENSNINNGNSKKKPAVSHNF